MQSFRSRGVILAASFLLAYTLAAVVGRRTVLEGTDVSLVWPAAGVAALWAVMRDRRRPAVVEVLVAALLTWAVNSSTGSTGWQAGAALSAGAVLQVIVFGVLTARWCPRLWASRGRALRREDLWWLLLAASLSAAISAPLAGVAETWDGDPWTSSVLWTWLARNSASALVVTTTALVVRRWWTSERHGQVGLAALVSASRVREYLAVVVLSPVLYVVWFVQLSDLPIIFPLIAVTVWVATRLHTTFVVLHDAAMGATAVGLTLTGIGPFAAVADPTSEVLVAQVYLAMVSVIGLALALTRDERNASMRDATAARAAAENQAELLLTVMDTMDEGMGVIDADAHFILRNATSAQILGGRRSTTEAVGSGSFYGFHHPDGTPMAHDDLPHVRALAGEVIRDVDVFVRNTGVPQGRIVSFNCTPLPAESGGGVVVMLRDVTAARKELELAAHVQASLLPTTAPRLPGYELAAAFVPAGSVGGDFYDWQATPKGVCLTLADVMGKGAGAAILAATLRSALQEHDPAEDVDHVLNRTETRLEPDLLRAGAFITATRILLDAPSGELTYADAGHGLTMIVRADGSAARLPSGGPPLGLVTGAVRTRRQDALEPGDTLVSFSDGVLDTIGGTLDDLSVLGKLVHGSPSAQHAVDAVVERAKRTAPLPDDVTVLAVRRGAR
ncbi:SpoIIE family protein phosphatase [Cellulomonas sp. NS3]|uniref:SpoIIE family protein phosphatase n=1 Tax=Cellulomonas sp. NS3 TaxID=2973977 RepID=UPI00216142A7|nr:SpoIIE family protein phosphatase [Cellulomonas sp. NS3]